jgi:hypothetical protein
VVSVILTWLLVLGAVPASGAEDILTAPLPASVALSVGNVSTSVLSEALAKLGFTSIGNVQRAGSIVRVDADWQGEPVKLRIDTRTGRIEPIK